MWHREPTVHSPLGSLLEHPHDLCETLACVMLVMKRKNNLHEIGSIWALFPLCLFASEWMFPISLAHVLEVSDTRRVSTNQYVDSQQSRGVPDQ